MTPMLGLEQEPVQAAAVPAEPYPFSLTPATTALVIIDMQRDFLEPGGFGEGLGNDVSLLQRVVGPLQVVLAAARANGMLVIHTREGHRSDMTDCPPSKRARGQLEFGIGSPGPKGRVLIRGEFGHGIVDELAPAAGEIVLDKPGKGAFYATDLELILRNQGITSLIVTGVTTEVCVHTTVREGNDRGFECLVVSDCVGSYFPEFHEVGLKMIAAQGGIFGWVAGSDALLGVLSPEADAGGSAPAPELANAIQGE
ncbi:MAG TPA: isochorismatase family cysteine hydrolase [Solirubrobacteraceae bacterium]|nr:isochorismatase family cysteine hydrolase [Solirubrobacteraceae bacterium]